MRSGLTGSEVAVLDDLFGAGRIVDEVERAKDRAFKALATLLLPAAGSSVST